MPPGQVVAKEEKKLSGLGTMKREKDGSLSSSRLPIHCPPCVFFNSPPPPPPLPPNPASLDLKEVSVQGRELFSDIQVLNLFINLPNNVFPLLIMMLDASKRRINSPRSN